MTIKQRIARCLRGLLKKAKRMCGCGMYVHAEEAATAQGFWLDLNLLENGSHIEEVEEFISEILSKRKSEQIEQSTVKVEDANTGKLADKNVLITEEKTMIKMIKSSFAYWKLQGINITEYLIL